MFAKQVRWVQVRRAVWMAAHTRTHTRAGRQLIQSQPGRIVIRVRSSSEDRRPPPNLLSTLCVCVWICVREDPFSVSLGLRHLVPSSTARETRKSCAAGGGKTLPTTEVFNQREFSMVLLEVWTFFWRSWILEFFLTASPFWRSSNTCWRSWLVPAGFQLSIIFHSSRGLTCSSSEGKDPDFCWCNEKMFPRCELWLRLCVSSLFICSGRCNKLSQRVNTKWVAGFFLLPLAEADFKSP